MLLPPGLQIYIRPRVALSIDFLTPKSIISHPFPVDYLYQFASESDHWFSEYRVW